MFVNMCTFLSEWLHVLVYVMIKYNSQYISSAALLECIRVSKRG